CVRCSKTLEMAWGICPYCATPQAVIAVDDVGAVRGVVGDTSARAPMAEQRARRRATRESSPPPASSGGSLEFVDGE
ncbi:MAG: hypothetical protein MUF38_09480, partial [Anaerolineae bacterium]|nr:hypothetical protein [Anaerolineae bacterium]